MNKRGNRVYWLLLIMVFIMGVCILADDKRGQDDTQPVMEENTQQNTTDTRSVATESTTEPASGEEVSEEVSEELSETTTADVAVVDNYYKNTVFMGDSIMYGFSTFASKETAPQWLKTCTFLAKVSWGIADALGDTGPMYQGKAQEISTSLAEIKPERIFINLGINEMKGLGSPGYSIEKLNGKYAELITKIKAASPTSKLYILNITPCTAEKETSMFSNETIRKFNQSIEEKADEWGIVYLDIASEFGTALNPELSSDGYVHHNSKAYSEIWVPFLEKTAIENK